ncbi:histidinol dehydrogenase [Patescibacteria group bacterium]|nr:histidinol dehydrogenase [Patescibacteria group bacterium]MBU2036494.1 histidinol dehydrogenase [Patescibacteria group bacterium]
MDNLRKDFIGKFQSLDLLKETLSIINTIEKNREKEILKYYKNKGINRKSVVITPQEIKKTLNKYDPDKLKIFKRLKATVASLAKKEKALVKGKLIVNNDKNFISTIYNTPLENIGIYIPQNLPSSLIFYCQLAKEAGVKNIVLALPPSQDGSVNPDLIAAASLFKIYKILAIGGRSAFPAMAFGLGGIIPNKLFGPCSLYVDHVKQVLNTFYKVPVDLPSGPSELLIFADSDIEVRQIEYDVRAQMEHGPDSRCFIISTSANLTNNLKKMTKDIKSQVSYFPVRNIDSATKLINNIGPEILEIFSRKPNRIIKNLKSIANVYVNVCSPLGDYSVIGKGCADPTYGMARGESGITISSFYKTSCVNFSLRKPKIDNPWFIEIPKIEGFKYHKKAIEKFLSKE